MFDWEVMKVVRMKVFDSCNDFGLKKYPIWKEIVVPFNILEVLFVSLYIFTRKALLFLLSHLSLVKRFTIPMHVNVLELSNTTSSGTVTDNYELTSVSTERVIVNV